jgi:predicted Zn-dependent protease
MITEAKCKKIIDLAIAHAGDRMTDMQVTVFEQDQATSRFANNEMTQHVDTCTTMVTITVNARGRTATFTTDSTSTKAIKRAVDKAIETAAVLPHDSTTLRVLKPSHLTEDATPKFSRYDPRIAALGPEDRLARVKSIVEVARRGRFSAAGIFATYLNSYAIGNSAGLFRFDQQTNVECSITMLSASSSGWQKGYGCNLDAVDPVALAQGAASRARKSRNPVYVRPGDYTVILEPSAVLDLICFLYDDFTGTEHWYETSSFCKKIGKSVLGKNITITDDANHELQTGFLFDDEGMNRKTVTIVENGKLKTPVKSRRSVKYLGGSPTGHGAAPSSAEGEFPMNIVVAGGDSSLEEMIASTQRGILLTRVWYVRDVDPNTKLLTGMTRDGTFLIENGKVTRGIKNLRFNQSVIDMLKNVVEIGQPVLAAGEETFPAVVPPMKIENFRFSSRTKA